jgi:hypothetical protein
MTEGVFAMTSYTDRLIPVIAAITAVIGGIAVAQQSSSRPGTEEKPTVEELIRRLNSESYKTREAATGALLHRKDALPALRRALHSENPEVRRRASEILAQKTAREEKVRLERARVCLKNGEIDSFVDLVTSLPDASIDERTWQDVLDLADRVVAEGGKKQRVEFFIPVPSAGRDTVRYDSTPLSRLGALKGLRFLRGVAREVVDREMIDNCLLLCSGRVEADQIFGHNIVFANGNVTLPDKCIIHSCLVVCDGSIECHIASGSILIATGTVKLRSGSPGGNLIIEHAHEALGLVKFFGTQQAGIQVAESRGQLVVEKVEPDTPFALAGMRPGDRIIAIDGQKVRTPTVFRQMVRRAFLLQEESVVTVERGDGPSLNVTVRPASARKP